MLDCVIYCVTRNHIENDVITTPQGREIALNSPISAWPFGFTSLFVPRICLSKSKILSFELSNFHSFNCQVLLKLFFRFTTSKRFVFFLKAAYQDLVHITSLKNVRGSITLKTYRQGYLYILSSRQTIICQWKRNFSAVYCPSFLLSTTS